MLKVPTDLPHLLYLSPEFVVVFINNRHAAIVFVFLMGISRNISVFYRVLSPS